MLLQVGRTAFALAITLMLATCTYAGVPKGFFSMSRIRRDAEFSKYDFDTQYDIYIRGMQEIEPPMVELSTSFAREGKEIVQPLRTRLERANKDRTVYDIVLVFHNMQILGTYDVASDKSLVQEMLLKLSAMRDPFWRLMTQDSILDIEKTAKNS
jgi:hypothetical protein